MNNKITIIIPTHYRHKYLDRVLDYYKECNIRILIADSTNINYSKQTKKNVEYYHYPDWEYNSKMVDILKKVTTPFAVMCADDDFITLSGIQACVDFIEENNDYSSTQGRYIGFSNNEVIKKWPAYFYSKDLDINGKDAFIRLKQLFNKYMHLYYSVHRLYNLRTAFEIANKKKIKNGRLVELLIAFVSCINGKHKVLPIFYSARESIKNSWGRITPSIKGRRSDTSYAKEYKKFISVLAELTTKQEKVKNDIVSDYITKVLNRYFYGSGESFINFKIFIYDICKTIIEGTNLTFLRYLKNKYKYLSYKKELRKNILEIKNCAGYPYGNAYADKEWKTILRIIKLYNI